MLTDKTKNLSSWVEIDTQALTHNLCNYKKVIGKALLAPVIKSNAYGHGIELVARVCDQESAVDALCVVSLPEALLLRSIGIKKPIVVISIALGDLEQAIIQNIDLIAYDLAFIRELNKIGKKLNKKANIHLKVDTGLSRMGLHPHDILKDIQELYELPFIAIKGIFTHLAESESADQSFTNNQIEQFNKLVAQLDTMGITIPIVHAACSAACTANPASHQKLVRLGIGLYGLWPSFDNKRMTNERYPDFSLKQVLTWKTRIIQIKELAVGSSVGYGRSHYVTKPTRIAILPVGYWDGYDRRLANRGRVLVNNQLAPVIGKVAMNLTTIDITGLDVSYDHEVTLLGNSPGVMADDLAQICGTIHWEIVTRINPLLPRISLV